MIGDFVNYLTSYTGHNWESKIPEMSIHCTNCKQIASYKYFVGHPLDKIDQLHGMCKKVELSLINCPHFEWWNIKDNLYCPVCNTVEFDILDHKNWAPLTFNKSGGLTTWKGHPIVNPYPFVEKPHCYDCEVIVKTKVSGYEKMPNKFSPGGQNFHEPTKNWMIQSQHAEASMKALTVEHLDKAIESFSKLPGSSPIGDYIMGKSHKQLQSEAYAKLYGKNVETVYIKEKTELDKQRETAYFGWKE